MVVVSFFFFVMSRVDQQPNPHQIRTTLKPVLFLLSLTLGACVSAHVSLL